jgi:glycosyltransferase involved in cell wall biosynthesis
MARILLSAYACEPGKGSEPEVGWNWAIEAARLGHEITVLTRANNRAAIERYHLAQPNLKFVFYDLPDWLQRAKHTLIGARLYYVLWQWFAVRHLLKRYSERRFDLVQHVTFVSIRYPSFLGALGIPFYFGPVAGGETVPTQLRSSFSLRQRWVERLRDLSNRFVRVDPLMQYVFRCATKIIVTKETLPLIPPQFRNRCQVQLGIGLPGKYADQSLIRQRPARSGLRLLYVGRLVEWKGLGIGLEAVSRLMPTAPEVNLTVIGDGPARRRLEKLAARLQISDRVEWLGWLPRAAVDDYYGSVDLLLFPSMRDSGGLVVLEALAHGLPVLTTDLGGPGMIVNHACGRTITTAGKSGSELVDAFADALQKLAQSPALLRVMSSAATIRAREFSTASSVSSLYAHLDTPSTVAHSAIS